MATNHHEPTLHPTAILSLRPTQMTLGMSEVHRKRDEWNKKSPRELSGFLALHMVPVIAGPKGDRYLIDHHHLARALHDQGVESVFVTVVADLSRMPMDHFWNMMEFHGWAHPYDAKGRRRPHSELPKTVKGMDDDPYRSLAGELRGAGGFAKDSTPFAEFLWADFLRPRLKAKAIRANFAEALKEALALAKTGQADYLPGWCGPHGFDAEAATKSANVKARKGKTSKASG